MVIRSGVKFFTERDFCIRLVTTKRSCIYILGAPIILSTPYFLDGYEKYADAMRLVPNRTLHETTIDVEPVSNI